MNSAHGRVSRPGGAIVVLVILLALLIGSVLWVTAEWARQRSLARVRLDQFASLVNIRNLREQLHSACFRGMLTGLDPDAAPADVRAAIKDPLANLDQLVLQDPVLQPLRKTLDERLDDITATLNGPRQAGRLPNTTSEIRDWFEASQTSLRKTIEALDAHRDHQLSKFNASLRETSDSAVNMQISLAAVLILALLGVATGTFFVRRENRRRDRVEAELRQSEHKLERAETIAKIGYWGNDRVSGRFTGSAEYFRILGLDHAPNPSVDAVLSRIHPDDRQAVQSVYTQLELDAKPRSVSFRVLVDGQTRHVTAHLTAETGQDKKVARIFGTLQDVSDHHRAESEARAWRLKFEAAARAARQILYDRRLSTGAITWDGGVQDLLGVPPESIADLAAWSSLVHPDDAERFTAEAARAAETRQPVSLEYRVRCADGDYLHVLDRGFPTDTDGDERIIGIISDLSDRKRLEHELLQAQKLESIGRLAGGVAHDLNNWLTAMLGYVELALSAKDPTRLRDWLSKTEEAGRSAALMTSQLLSFARRQMIEPRVCSLNEVVRDACALLARLLREDVELVVIPSPDLWRVRVDPGQFQQVIVNLALNARDAMPEGGRLTIETANVTLDESYASTHPEVTPGPHVLLAVSDTGVGIPEESLSKVFEPFYTTKPRGSGTGLGLATVLGLVKQHGGHIWVYSELGKGTSFKVYLPRAEGRVLASREQEVKVLPPRGSETVLVVEDERLVRELAVDVLKGQGYAVLCAVSGEDALRIAQEHQGSIDLLLTDVVMPGLGGKELAQRLVTQRPGLSIVYTSGYTDSVIAPSAPEGSRSDFLQKPYSPSTLAGKVRQVLDAVPR